MVLHCATQEVKNSDALRAAIAQVQDGDVRLGSRFSESRALYDAFGALQNSTVLTEVQQRIVEGIQLTAVQGGVTLQVKIFCDPHACIVTSAVSTANPHCWALQKRVRAQQPHCWAMQKSVHAIKLRRCWLW